ncbi:MAG: glycosyltransferase family protein [Hyphomicrobiales bacterium]
MSRRDHARILIYCNDAFGLGRLRRCWAVANALVGKFKGLFVLIISGSQVPTSMGLRARVDFVKIPSVIKLYDGQYTAMDDHIDLSDTRAIRRTIIRNTAASFEPDVMIVDGDPFGLSEEIRDTLEHLKARRCTLTLALPDIVDEAERMSADVLGTIDALYDKVWIYGSRGMSQSLSDTDTPASLASKVAYTGYLRRNFRPPSAAPDQPFTNPYILVTADDGGEEPGLMDWVLTAYEHDATLPHPALLALGPLMPQSRRKIIQSRAARFANVDVLDGHDSCAALMPNAVGVIAPAGYDMLCQILSLDKRAILVPQPDPGSARAERAERAARLDLAALLTRDEASDPYKLAAALHAFPTRPLPSQCGSADMLLGIETICADVEGIIGDTRMSA